MSEEWKKRLLPASFRGVPFFIESHEFSGGRKVVGHEPTDRDSTFSEDTGIKQKTYALDCHVIGDNYFFIRDALIKAMDNRDPGVLIHPYLGAKDVRPASFSVSETISEGRIAKLSLQFVDAGEKSFPTAKIDAVTSLLTSVASTVAIVQNAFQTAFKIASLPAFAISSTRLAIEGFFTDLRNGIDNVRTNPEKKAEIIKKIDEAEAEVESLILNNASLASTVDSIVSDLAGVVEEPTDNDTIDISNGRNEKLVIFDTVINFTTNYINIIDNTPTRVSEKANNKALDELIVGIGIARIAEAASLVTYQTKDKALEIRESISSKIVEQLNIVSDDTFQALKDLNAKVTEAIPNPNENLSTISTIKIPTEQNSILLAYDLFESKDFEKDIINRNGVRNPGFISGDIEVLNG